MPFLILVELVWHARPRTDKTHLTHQYVKELRQLIEARSAKQPAETRDAGIVGHFLDPFRSAANELRGKVLVDRVVRVLVHRAKFIEDKRLTVLADPRLFVQHPPVRRRLDDECDRR